MHKKFTITCAAAALAALAQTKHHGGHGHHIWNEEDHSEADQKSIMKPTKNLWNEFWGEREVLNGLGSMFKCQSCALGMSALSSLLEVGFIHSGILDIAAAICEYSGAMNHRFHMCPLLVHQFGEPMFTVVEDYLLSKDRICNEHFGWCTSPVITPIDLDTVVDNILSTKPTHVQNDDYIQNLYEQMAQSTEERPTLRALHLSDVHIDFAYTPGTLSSCKDYLCCHVASGYPKHDGDVAAGNWGAEMCDIPVRTYQSMLDDMVTNNLPDVIFWTGDNTSHEVWDNTADETVGYTVAVTQLLKQAIQGKDVAVFPIQGNHDTWVEEIESFAAPGINYEINNFKQYWREWLTDEAYEKFGEYGYYSQPITLLNGKKLSKPARVIALNTQACDSLNWYIVGQRDDPGHQFAWLEQQLLEAEAEDGIAYIIAHYTPNQCQHQFGSRYRALMERFQATVRFTMHGHTHTGYYEIVQSYTNPGTPLMFANVAGSVTTYSVQNPSYQIIEIDQETMLPVNIYVYAMDIDKANETGKPSWDLIIDYKKRYGIPDLGPQSMKKMSERILTDQEFALQFNWDMHAQHGSKPITADQKSLYCLTTSSEMWEEHECNETEIGQRRTKHGRGFDIWTLQGLCDYLVGDWINISID